MEESEAKPAVVVEKREENPSSAVSQSPTPPTSAVTAVVGPIRKKRGRPRKYAPDGSPNPTAMALSPMPISASMPPPAREFPAMSAAALATALMKQRGGGRPGPGPGGVVSTNKQKPRVVEFENFGEMVSCAAGANFTPHILTVAAGEDVTMKIISFSQEGSRAICILSANGIISNVTLRQADSSGGTLTYEGRFELLSLSGSFMPTDSGGTRSRTGGMSVALVGPDGRVVGGGVAGLLVAATPVQVVVGSFLPSYQMEQKTKKPKYNNAPSITTTTTNGIQMTFSNMDDPYGGGDHLRNSTTTNHNHHVTSPPCGENSWSTIQHPVPDTRNSSTDINASLPSG